jgi:hypothetical protein
MLRLIVCSLFCFSILSCTSSSSDKISGDAIQSSLQKGGDVNYDGYTITSDLDLIDPDAAVKVTPAGYNVYVKGALVFKNCIFTGKVTGNLKSNEQNTYSCVFLKSLYFENCTFEDVVDLEGATINGYCNFLNCNFKKDALFNRSTFNSTTAFTKCIFTQTAGFQSATFANNAFYNEAHFNQACFFQNSFFYREFTFNVVIADGYTDFSSVNFYSNVYCNYAQFHKDLVFNNGNFKGRTEFVGSKFETAEFDGSLFYGPAIFEKSDFAESLSLKDSKFLLAKPRTAGYKAAKIDISGVEVIGLGKLNEF